MITWGGVDAGGDSTAVLTQLSSDVEAVFSTNFAFAAVKTNGSVVTWGDSRYGGDSSAVADQLSPRGNSSR